MGAHAPPSTHSNTHTHTHESPVTHKNCVDRGKVKGEVKLRSRKKNNTLLPLHDSNWPITAILNVQSFLEGRIHVSHIKSFNRTRSMNGGEIPKEMNDSISEELISRGPEDAFVMEGIQTHMGLEPCVPKDL